MSDIAEIQFEVVAEVPDEVGPYLAVHSDGANRMRWAMATRTHVLLLEGSNILEIIPVADGVYDLAFTPDGAQLLAAPTIIDWAKRAIVPREPLIDSMAPDLGGTERVVTAAFDELGERLLVSIERVADRSLQTLPSLEPHSRIVWLDAANNDLIDELAEVGARHATVAVGRERLAVASIDVLRFGVPPAVGMTRLTYHGHSVTRMAFEHSTDARLASGDAVGCVAVWSPDGSSPASCWRAHPSAVQGLAWHPSGLLVTGGREGELCAWDQDELVGRLTFDGPIAGIAFDATGQWLAVALDSMPIPRLVLGRVTRLEKVP